MSGKYFAFGSDGFASAPVLLTNPTTGNLKTALDLRDTALNGVAAAFRVISISGNISVTDSKGNTATWAASALEGYQFPIKDISMTGTVLVFY